MAGVGKLILSATNLNPEVQASLAAFNFDFSLLKVEAPKEYAGVGSTLTNLRRTDAEDGLSHITVRKLAALFTDEIPPTTLLFKAYGHRASDISNSPTANPRGLAKHGAFADHVGADSTTVWAAATSGTEALSIHLLSCLLARIWAADEAVAVWVELIKERKLYMHDRIQAGGSFHGSYLFASKIDISRSQLVAWDASTRAWLNSADRVKRKEQTQLRLVIDNITLPVSRAKTMYGSVIQTWKSSMTLMEDILGGKSLSVETGDLLLGLSSWHIYPDLSVVANQTTHVMQHDELIPDGTIVTIGLISKASDSGSGVYWSLPLAHLRHYGKPIVRTGRSGLADSRVPFHDLMFVALGSIFQTWQASDTDFDKSLDIIRLLGDSLSQGDFSVVSWLQPLYEACKRYDSSKELERKQAYQLMRLGYRYGDSFIASEKDQPSPVFGLTDLNLLLRLCLTAEIRIKLLRYWAKKNLTKTEGAVIRYFLPNSEVKRYALINLPSKKRKRNDESSIRSDHPEHWVHQSVATTKSIRFQSGLHSRLDDPREWLPREDTQVSNEPIPKKSVVAPVNLENWVNKEFLRDLTPFEDEEQIQQNEMNNSGQLSEGLGDDCGPATYVSRSQAPSSAHKQVGKVVRIASRSLEDGPFLSNNQDDDIDNRDPGEKESSLFWIPYPAWTHAEGEEKVKPYSFAGGIIGLAAVFVPSYWVHDSLGKRNLLTCGQLEQFLLYQKPEIRSAFLSSTLSRNIWLARFEKRHQRYAASLKALRIAYDIYQNLPNAYVDLHVRRKPLHEAAFYSAPDTRWILENSPHDSKICQTFSCIALFETGFIDLPPSDLRDVMAICYQDSLYVAQTLLQDPGEENHSCLVTRIMGNIGKPGLSILHPPAAPEVSAIDVDSSWQLVNYHPFDGVFEDNFSTTSLHLSFTGSSVAYGAVGTGNIHRDVYFVETLIQAYSRGTWIADLDVLGARRQMKFGWPDYIKNKRHVIATQLCSVDTWEELLSTVPKHAIFRAYKNWMARLAAATILAQQGRRFRVITCSGDKPSYHPRINDAGAGKGLHRGYDQDADEVFENWNEPWLDHHQSASIDENFESFLESEAQYAKELNDSITSDVEDIDSSSGIEVGDKNSNSQHRSRSEAEQQPSPSPSPSLSISETMNPASNDGEVAGDAVILIC